MDYEETKKIDFKELNKFRGTSIKVIVEEGIFLQG